MPCLLILPAYHASTPQVDDCAVSGVHKGTVVRGEGDIGPGGSLRITDCHDAVIYVLAPVQVRCGLLYGLRCGLLYSCGTGRGVRRSGGVQGWAGCI